MQPLHLNSVFFCAMALLSSVILSACDNSNRPLPTGWTQDSPTNYSFSNWLDRRKTEQGKLDDTFIMMAMSGGGIRATALAYAVVKELTKFHTASNQELARDVGLISSTSGGSVTAAQIGLFGVDDLDEQGEGQKQAGASQSLRQFIYGHNTFWLIFNLINPVSESFVLNPFYNRATGLQDHFSASLFGKKTFRDMGRNGAPFVVFNGSDMGGGGSVFAFTQDVFTDICSDLNQLPVAVAVTASAAFPFALQPVGFTNHSVEPDCRRIRHSSSNMFQTAYDRRHVYPELFDQAKRRNELRRDGLDAADASQSAFLLPQNISYVWILDGGLSDNLGIISLRNSLGETELAKLQQLGVKNIVYVEINAKSETDALFNTSPYTPNYFQVASSVTGNPIDATSSAIAELAQTQFKQSLSNYYNFYPVQIRFDLVDDATLASRVRSLKTWWSLKNSELDDILTAGGQVLRSDPCFRKFAQQAKLKEAFQLSPWLPQTCLADVAAPKEHRPVGVMEQRNMFTLPK